MPQSDFVIENQSFASSRLDVQSSVNALASLSSGATAPSAPIANMLWFDTANNVLKMRSAANDAWGNVGAFDQSANAFIASLVAVLDASTLAEGSATRPPSQRAVKAYVDGLTLGVGQSLANKTAERALDTTYTNTTGRTIWVSVACVYTDDGLDLLVGGVVAARHETGSGTGVHTATLSAPVPPGATYRATITAGSPGLSLWSELA